MHLLHDRWTGLQCVSGSATSSTNTQFQFGLSLSANKHVLKKCQCLVIMMRSYTPARAGPLPVIELCLKGPWFLFGRLVEDTAWHPVSKQELGEWKGTFKGWLYRTFLGSPLKSWASVGHWLIWHFDTSKYSEKQQDRVSCGSLQVAFSQVNTGSLLRHHHMMLEHFDASVGTCERQRPDLLCILLSKTRASRPICRVGLH